MTKQLIINNSQQEKLFLMGITQVKPSKYLHEDAEVIVCVKNKQRNKKIKTIVLLI